MADRMYGIRLRSGELFGAAWLTLARVTPHAMVRSRIEELTESEIEQSGRL